MRSSTGSGRIFGSTDISSTMASIDERHLSSPPSGTSVPLALPNLLASHLQKPYAGFKGSSVRRTRTELFCLA
jgi:hypothetical protein